MPSSWLSRTPVRLTMSRYSVPGEGTHCGAADGKCQRQPRGPPAASTQGCAAVLLASDPLFCKFLVCFSCFYNAVTALFRAQSTVSHSTITMQPAH